MAGRGRILVVDDDASVREMLVEYLRGHEFDAVGVGDGVAMRAEISHDLPNLVLLDLRLPGEDGLALARHLRERCDAGIIMVTGSGDVIDRVVGLEMGADDYIAKPFDPRELLARVRSVMRRMQARDAPDLPAPSSAAPSSFSASGKSPLVTVGRCRLDPDARRLFDADGIEVPITAMEFDLLRVFLANPNRVLTRDQLLAQTRHREWEPFDRSIDIRIGRLRRKIEIRPNEEPRTIRTVRNAGYMYVPE